MCKQSTFSVGNSSSQERTQRDTTWETVHDKNERSATLHPHVCVSFVYLLNVSELGTVTTSNVSVLGTVTTSNVSVLGTVTSFNVSVLGTVSTSNVSVLGIVTTSNVSVLGTVTTSNVSDLGTVTTSPKVYDMFTIYVKCGPIREL